MIQPVAKKNPISTIVAQLAFLLISLFSISSFAQKSCELPRSSNKPGMSAAIPDCVPNMTYTEAREILSQNNNSFPGAKDEEVIAFGKAIRQINGSFGGTFKETAGATLNFINSSASSKQTGPKSAQICRQTHSHAGNVNHLVHELGHIVGNQGFYSKYWANVPSKCQPTQYSSCYWSKGKERNEEFAEVFALYMGNPSLLKNDPSPGCQAAYRFFAKNFAAKDPSSCDPGTIVQNAQRSSFDYSSHDSIQDETSTKVEKAKKDSSTMSGFMGLFQKVLPLGLAFMAQQNAATTAAAPAATTVAPIVAPAAPVRFDIPTNPAAVPAVR